MPRSVGAFRKAGWNVLAYPVDYQTLSTAGQQLRFNFRGGINEYAYREFHSVDDWFSIPKLGI